jgi:CspA family cold shock protein
MSSASSSDTSAPVRLTGRVKWFNNKTGFGFISVVGGNDQYKDASEVFVHHSAVKVSQEQYRYLVEGEYVEFSVVTTETGDHKFQAGDVRGVKGGKLFCETRHEHRASHDGGAGSGAGAGAGADKSERGRPQLRGRGGVRGGRVDRGGRGGSEWMLVRRDRNEQQDSRVQEQERGRSRGRGRGRGQNEEYSQRPTRSDKSSSHPQSSAPAPAPVPTEAPATAPAKHEAGGVGDVPATPRTASKKAPRQAKPSV